LSDKKTCCLTRRKVIVGILKILTEEECGIGEGELAGFIRWGKKTSAGTTILAFRFCPWCGEERDPEDEARITEHVADVEELEEEEEGAVPPLYCRHCPCRLVPYPSETGEALKERAFERGWDTSTAAGYLCKPCKIGNDRASKERRRKPHG